MTVRIYGKQINEWKSTDEHGREIVIQIEREYTDYNSITGEVVGCGSEDIPVHWTLGRRATTTCRWVYTWDGEKLNKGGKRWFDYQGQITYRVEAGAVKGVKELLKHKHPKAVEIQIRG